MLCTLAQLKLRLGIGSADQTQDALLAQIITGVSAELAGAEGAGRPLEEAEIVEHFSVDGIYCEAIYTRAWPIVSVDEVLETWDGDWEGADELVADDDYWIEAAAGAIHRLGWWLPGRAAIRATYTAGYVPAETAADGEFEIADGQVLIPADITEAAIVQAVHSYQRRTSPGMTGESVQGASVNYYATQGLLPGVKAIMQRYRRAM